MKIAIAGKGGVGKTAVTSLLAHHWAARGQQVLAIDGDPSPCLGAALGFPREALDGLRPIAEMKQLIAERTGTEPGDYGSYFKINPTVDDLPERFSVTRDGIRLLLLGALEKGGSGCICPGSALLKALITHIVLRRDETVLLDLYAGVEHLGRATAHAVDAMLVVADPTRASVRTAAQIRDLAADIGLTKVFLVGNKVRDEEDRRFLSEAVDGLELLGAVSWSPHFQTADRQGLSAYSLDPNAVTEISRLGDALQSRVAS
jgi:CO dehydrogenase maturation factor